MFRSIVLVLLLAPMGIHAQQTQQQPPPEIRALNARVGMEINSNLQCSAQVFSLQDRLAAAEAEIKRLADKYEPKQDTK